MTAEDQKRQFADAVRLEKELDFLREGGVSEEGLATFRRLHPVFKRIFKWEETQNGRETN